VIGIAYGRLLVAIWGAEWLRQPGIAEPLILALALLVLPYFVMMPGMGLGIAGSRTPKPNVTRLKSVIGHSMFGIGMYLTARLMAALRFKEGLISEGNECVATQRGTEWGQAKFAVNNFGKYS
jgi:Protein of unknown function (DUF2938)